MGVVGSEGGVPSYLDHLISCFAISTPKAYGPVFFSNMTSTTGQNLVNSKCKSRCDDHKLQFALSASMRMSNEGE